MDTSTSSKMAFTLNRNAGRVTEKLAGLINNSLPDAKIFISKDENEAENHVKTILGEKYKYIFSGGGDGTIYTFLNHVRKHSGRNLEEHLNLGLLGLGTGNGLAVELKADNLETVLKRIKTGTLINTKKYNLIEADGKVVHFSSLGLDAQILNDFIEVKNEHPFFKRKHMGLPGYLMAYLTKSTKSETIRNSINIRVINEGDTVYKISCSKGAKLLPVNKGDIIYEGPANLAGVATASYYGFKFKVFPFARSKEDFMNLRIVNISNLEFVTKIHSLWTGTYENENTLHDFLVKKVRIQFSKPAPFQMGGDAKGYRDEVVYEVSEHKVKIMDFS